MGRRSDHTRGELEALLVSEGRRQLAQTGLARFSAREVAREVGYSIGTLYNVFGSYDGLMLAINARTLTLWAQDLRARLANAGEDRIATLVDMFFDPSLVPAGFTIRDIAGASNAGMSKDMLNRYLRERGDANIKSLKDLINKSQYYRDIRPEAGFIDRKAALEETNNSMTLDMANVFQDRFAYQQVVLQCMAQENLDALVSPAGNIPAYILGQPIEPPLAGRTNSVWGLLGQHGFPTLSVPAGFTTHVLIAFAIRRPPAVGA